MLINGFIVAAQILNFLILVVLLRWLLYKPILKVMQQRQALITEQWQAAEQLQREAERAATTYQQQQQAFQQQQAELLAAAQVAADQERQRLLAETRAAIAAQRATWQAELQQEQDAFLHRLRQQVIHQVAAIARQALKDLANAELEAQLVQVFCDRLHQLDPPKHQAIAQALSQTTQPILVRSSFELPPDRRQQVTHALRTQFAIAQPLEFVTTSDLFCGIEIKLAGQEIVWGLDTYLQTLEQQLANALMEEKISPHEPYFSADADCLH